MEWRLNTRFATIAGALTSLSSGHPGRGSSLKLNEDARVLAISECLVQEYVAERILSIKHLATGATDIEEDC